LWVGPTKDAVVASGVAPHHGCGLVLPDISRMHNASRLVVATKLRENQTSCNGGVAKVGLVIATVLREKSETKQINTGNQRTIEFWVFEKNQIQRITLINHGFLGSWSNTLFKKFLKI
jgi:hypothetical protein